MGNWLKKILGIPEPRVIKMWEHQDWGNAIHFTNYETREVYGWLKNKPKKGDLLQCKMKSGQIGEYKFLKVRYCEDPPDMFFATVSYGKHIIISETITVTPTV